MIFKLTFVQRTIIPRSIFWTLVLAVVFVSTLAVLLSGCDDDATKPESTEPFPYALTLESLLDTYRQAFEDMDLDAYRHLLAPDYRFFFSEGDDLVDTLPVDHLNRFEDLLSLANMAAGQPLENLRGELIAPMSHINFNLLDQRTGWESSTHPHFPDAEVAVFEVDLEFSRPVSTTILVSGPIEFYVVQRDSVFTDGSTRSYWQFAGMADQTNPVGIKSTENAGFGMTKFLYLTNDPPTADFALSPQSGTTETVFHCDGSPSSDPDGGLRDEPYQWWFSDTGWTGLSDDPTTEHTFSTSGNHTIRLVVYDRWLATDTLSHEVDVSYAQPFPGTREQVLANFRRAHEDRNINDYRNTLHTDYKFILREQDIIEQLWPIDHFDRDEDLAIMTRIFSGEPYFPPEGAPEAAVTQISFSVLDRLSVWETSTHPDFRNADRALFEVDLEFMRPVSTTLLVSGQVEFYVTSRDSLHDDTTRPYWQILGIVDGTDSGGKPAEQASWGIVKFLYR